MKLVEPRVLYNLIRDGRVKLRPTDAWKNSNKNLVYKFKTIVLAYLYIAINNDGRCYRHDGLSTFYYDIRYEGEDHCRFFLEV